MSVTTQPESRPSVFNLPNQLTLARLLLSIVLVILMGYQKFATSLVVFLAAATTDWLDGYFARKYGLITTLGRILDPFVDKIIICGVFICLVADARSQVQAWMAVVVVGRELLITALRSFLEQQGADFSASLSGKIKMILQCIAASASLLYLTLVSRDFTSIEWLKVVVIAAVWAAVIVTVYSGYDYVRRAMSIVRAQRVS